MSHEKLAATFDAWAKNGRADSMETHHRVPVEQILDAHETQIIYYGRLAKAKGGSEGPSVEDYGHHLSPARGPQTRRPLRRTVFGAA